MSWIVSHDKLPRQSFKKSSSRWDGANESAEILDASSEGGITNQKFSVRSRSARSYLFALMVHLVDESKRKGMKNILFSPSS